MAHCRDTLKEFTLKELSLADIEEGVSRPGSSCTVDIDTAAKLVCVEYPAIVSNVDKMLDSIGGEQGLTKTYGDPSRRLEMRYRPQDPFCHSLCGNRVPSSNLLLRVKRRTRRADPTDSRLSVDVLGVIGTTYKFQGMADFQSLAVRRTEDGEIASLYDKIVLKKSENQEFFEQQQALFLPPPIFSRLDNPVDYHYRPDIHHNQVPITRENFIGQNRARRPHNAIFVSFVDPMPTTCIEAARDNWERVCQTDHDRETEAKLVEMFKQRPVWSRNAVKANLEIHPDKLKLLLPVCAYYMVTGPWRSLWIRLGYDPRKSPESKKYQLLDFRIRYSAKHGFTISDMPVKAKRSTLVYTLPNTFNKMVPRPASVSAIPCQDGPSTSSRQPAEGKETQPNDSMYIFREGMLPPHRQMFYQLCDLHVQSIQDLIIRNDGQETDCDEKDGWCLPHTTDQLRDLLSTMIKKVMTSTKPVPLPLTRQAYDAEEGEEEDEEEEDEEGDFQPSEGSENEMEAEMLDYM